MNGNTLSPATGNGLTEPERPRQEAGCVKFFRSEGLAEPLRKTVQSVYRRTDLQHLSGQVRRLSRKVTGR
jgi:hypothetical protein